MALGLDVNARLATGAALILTGVGGSVTSFVIDNRIILITALVASALVITAGVIVFLNKR